MITPKNLGKISANISVMNAASAIVVKERAPKASTYSLSL